MIGTLRSEVSADQEVVTEGGSSKKVPCMWWTALGGGGGGVVVYRRGYIKSLYVGAQWYGNELGAKVILEAL